MKIQKIDQLHPVGHNTFKGCNNMTKYGIGALITSVSLFTLSNAMDTFDCQGQNASKVVNIDIPASIFGIAGTFLSLIGLKNDEGSGNRYT